MKKTNTAYNINVNFKIRDEQERKYEFNRRLLTIINCETDTCIPYIPHE